MRYNPEKHHRHSIRLKGYDYTQAGAYFITICTHGRECLFGEVVDGEMRLNDAGRMIESVWNEMPAFYPGVNTDGFVVMPNHVHGIVVLVGATAGDVVGAAPRGRPRSGRVSERGQPQGVVPTGVGSSPGQAQGPAPTGVPMLSLPDVMHRFKTMTTKRYADGVKHSGWVPFSGRLWQRNYYEHIIRDEESLNRIREYIVNNPLQWALDRENPDFVGAGSEPAPTGPPPTAPAPTAPAPTAPAPTAPAPTAPAPTAPAPTGTPLPPQDELWRI